MTLKRNIEIAHPVRYKILNDLQHAHQHIFFTKTVSHIWITSLNNLQFRQFTTAEYRDSIPSPDGEWIFLSDRTKRQLLKLIYYNYPASCLHCIQENLHIKKHKWKTKNLKKNFSNSWCQFVFIMRFAVEAIIDCFLYLQK